MERNAAQGVKHACFAKWAALRNHIRRTRGWSFVAFLSGFPGSQIARQRLDFPETLAREDLGGLLSDSTRPDGWRLYHIPARLCRQNTASPGPYFEPRCIFGAAE